MNPAEWLRRTAAGQPDAPALFKGTTEDADYAVFAARAGGIGAALSKRGIGKGERVALFMANCTEYLETLYGIWWAGAVAVPINAKLHAKEAAWIIGRSGAALVFADGKRADALKGHTIADVIGVDGEGFAKLRDEPQTCGPVPLSDEDIAWLFFTSGTTGGGPRAS